MDIFYIFAHIKTSINMKATTEDIKDIKYDVMREIFEIDDISVMLRLKKYINNIFKKESPNATTLEAMKEAERGEGRKFDDFEDFEKYVRSV
jgi:hypothetical protein